MKLIFQPSLQVCVHVVLAGWDQTSHRKLKPELAIKVRHTCGRHTSVSIPILEHASVCETHLRWTIMVKGGRTWKRWCHRCVKVYVNDLLVCDDTFQVAADATHTADTSSTIDRLSLLQETAG